MTFQKLYQANPSFKAALKTLYIIVLIPLLFSCAVTEVENIKAGQEQKISEEEGYVFLSVDTKYQLNKIGITGKRNYILTESDLRWGSNYVLFKAPAGDYRFNQLKINDIENYKLFKQYWSFSVDPNKINYLGEFTVGSEPNSFYLSNESSSALKYLEKNYSELIEKYYPVYKGPGEDDFFEYVRAFGGDKK